MRLKMLGFLVCILSLFTILFFRTEVVQQIKYFYSNITGLTQHSAYYYYITKYQRVLNANLATQIRGLKNEGSLFLFVSLLALSFIYGIFHALGPGHGKTVISSWIVIKERRLADIFQVSVFAAIFHALSASLMVFGTYLILGKLAAVDTQELNAYLQDMAAILLILIGLGMLIQFVRTKITREKSIIDKNSRGILLSRPLVIALSIGIVPCPVTSVILIFCLASGLIWQGIALVTSFAIGMGSSILAIALMVWLFKGKITGTKSSVFQYVTSTILPVIGGIFFILSGMAILMSTILPPG